MRRWLSFEISAKKKIPRFCRGYFKNCQLLSELLIGFVGVPNDHQNASDDVDKDKGTD